MKKLVLLLVILFTYQSLFAQKNTVIYWDASYSMIDRKLDRELQFLDNYFKKYADAEIKLIMFSNDILSSTKFSVKDGDWSTLREELKNTVYDGATAYKGLFKDTADEYLLFTDGIENMDHLNAPKEIPIHVITTVTTNKMPSLKLISDLSDGRFFYLDTKPLTDANVQEKAEEKVVDVNNGTISGLITGVEGNLTNVSVVNQTSNLGVASDTKGFYSIDANEGDIVVFSYLGKKTVSIRIGKANVVNITMANIRESLDTVIIEADLPEEVEMVNTGNIKVDKRRLGYAIEEITSDDISELDTDLIGSIKGQFTNLEIPNQVYDKVDISQFLGRGKNMTMSLNQYGLIVVDGIPLGQSDSGVQGLVTEKGTVFVQGGSVYKHNNIINPDMIHSISYLKGLAATNKYGTLGRNGVLLITTKNAVATQAIGDNKSNIPLGTTETYSGSAKSIESLPNTPYINALKNSESVNQAFATYLEQRAFYGNDPIFYLDVADYFKGWQNPLITQRILSNVYEIAFNDTEVLRALSFKQQSMNFNEDALVTLKRIADIEPNQSQSYRDLALGYVDMQQYDDALKLYNNIDKNVGVGNMVLAGIQKTFTNEFKNLISLHGTKLNMYGVDQKYRKPIKYKSRIVFQWNDLNAEFDLNIVNPQNRFFTWSHTNAENSQEILQQKQQGYGIEEFYLTQDDIGEWNFNVKYYGNGSDEPTFVKITTYTNFGEQNQTKKVKVVRLNKTNIEQSMIKLVVR